MTVPDKPALGAFRASPPPPPPPRRRRQRGGKLVPPLDDVKDYLARYVAFPSPGCLCATTLWTAHTHVVDAFDTTPRLALISPEKQSGKSRCLEAIEVLSCGGLQTVNTTVAALFRLIQSGSLTLLFDEVDTIFGAKAKEHEELRGLL